MLSNYPPGCRESDIPGYNDRDISYNATATITYTYDIDINQPTLIPTLTTDQNLMIDTSLKPLNQSYIQITPTPHTFKIIRIEPNDYIVFSYEATIISDTTYDTNYIDPESDTDLINDIIEDITHKLSHTDLEIDIDPNNVEYEIN